MQEKKTALNTLQPTKTEESDKEFQVKSKLLKDVAVRSKAGDNPQGSGRSNRSEKEKQKTREERVSPLIYNQPMSRPRAGNSKR
mmetsp:Transcript_13959/g.21764  ORF Transcript_13959/g.21764 Transcript_13959/m.21764 type:complete len:84 (-) Transcript_13959:729-980(-)